MTSPASLVHGVAVCCLLFGCAGDDADIRLVTLRGKVLVPPEFESGTIHLVAYQSWSLEGDLRHPLQRLSDWQLPENDFDLQVEYPAHPGEGIAALAWIDLDNDGVHCTPQQRAEPSGLTVVDDVGDTVELTVQVSTRCAGADWFFPAAPDG